MKRGGSNSEKHPLHDELIYVAKTVLVNRILKSLVSRKALKELNALRAIPVYPIFEDKKSKESDKELVERKIALYSCYKTRL